MCNNLVLGGLPRVHENDYKIEAVQDQKFQSMLNFRRNFNNQNSREALLCFTLQAEQQEPQIN
jgi:hypothetical protein